MKEILSKIFDKLITEKKGFKIIAWVFIFIILSAIIFYPIIDANFLYFNRANKRIDIIQKLVNLDDKSIQKDSRIEEEYNHILEDMANQNDNYMSNIFHKETSKKRNIAKFVSGAWLFFIVGIYMPFAINKENGKRFTLINIISGIVCILISGILGYVCFIIPNIINFMVNIALYNIILIFLAYTLSKSNNKK